jgi:hypothetical protein
LVVFVRNDEGIRRKEYFPRERIFRTGERITIPEQKKLLFLITCQGSEDTAGKEKEDDINSTNILFLRIRTS